MKMGPKLPLIHSRTSPNAKLYVISYNKGEFCKYKFPARIVSEQKFPFKFVRQSLGDRWKLNDISASSIQERMNMLLSKTQDFLNEVSSPIAKSGQNKKPAPEDDFGFQVMEDIFMVEETIERRTENGILSLAAVTCVEQFSRYAG